MIARQVFEVGVKLFGLYYLTVGLLALSNVVLALQNPSPVPSYVTIVPTALELLFGGVFLVATPAVSAACGFRGQPAAG